MKKMTKRLACLVLALVLACCALPGVTYGATTSVDLNQNYLFRARTNAFSFGTGETANLTFTPQYTAKYTLKLYGHVTGGRNIRASLTNPDGTVTDFEYPNRTGSTVKDYSHPYLLFARAIILLIAISRLRHQQFQDRLRSSHRSAEIP